VQKLPRHILKSAETFQLAKKKIKKQKNANQDYPGLSRFCQD